MAHHKHHKEHHKAHHGKGQENSMSHAGLNQGDMSPKVHDYQKPSNDFAERGFSKTTEYIERQDKMQSGMAHGLEKQAYVGRYS